MWQHEVEATQASPRNHAWLSLTLSLLFRVLCQTKGQFTHDSDPRPRVAISRNCSCSALHFPLPSPVLINRHPGRQAWHLAHFICQKERDGASGRTDSKLSLYYSATSKIDSMLHFGKRHASKSVPYRCRPSKINPTRQ
ncbi:hypothetical protein BCR34DRAFT_135361 [Clohesyomyces aquaticus]|uniref:Secreted protein n=1 Tax=Clohesyomyces aquaticus TaxID=1231657 RepID=A0A1Y2ABC9_9PLEO|nr:hypothetical protein BCR34DRAFT_135361 [Clohesyomyces aquaticus]